MKGFCLLIAACLAVSGAPALKKPFVSAQAEAAPIEIKHLRGVVADPNWAVIPKAQVILQEKKDGSYHELQSLQTDERGRFDFGEGALGIYRIYIIAPHGFCRVLIPVKLSEKGWAGLKVAVPVAVYDAHPGNCDQALKINQTEE